LYGILRAYKGRKEKKIKENKNKRERENSRKRKETGPGLSRTS
jgi:hypothetical protein